MRTKHLLMTMALPLAFAACTSDEFESFDQGNGLKNRKEIGQVAIAFENGDALTRWTSGMQPEVGDRVGAVSIDNLKDQEYNEEKPESNYETSKNQIFSNYMYENNGNGKWVTNANLVEGGYYFYAPYVASQGRSLMKLNAPVVQKLDVEDGKIVGNSAIVNFIEEGTTPFYIGYKFLSAAEENTDITVKMRHIFAYPRLEFTNKTGEAVKLQRILIQSNDGLIESASLSNIGIGNLGTDKGVLYMTGEQTDAAIADAVADAEDDNTAPFHTWGAWSKTFAQEESLEYLRTANLLTDVKETTVIRIELESPVTVADDETISFGVILPANKFADKQLQVNYVTTDDEAYTWRNDGSVTTMLGDAYVAEDYNEDGSGTLKEAEPMFAFEATEIDEDFEMINLVTSTEELIDVIDANRASTTSLVITLAGEDIEFNKDVYNAVSRQKAQGLTLNGTINIIGGADEENALKIERGVRFDNAIVKEGYVAFNYSTLSYKDVEVKEDAVLTVSNIDRQGNIKNHGTLKVATQVSGIDNYGEVEVLKGGKVFLNTIADKDLAAASTVTYSADAVAELSGTIEYNVVNNGTLTIEDGTVLTSRNVINNVSYATTFTNNGEINMSGAAINNGTLTNNGTIYGTQTLTNAGTVNNNDYIQCAITNAKVNKAATGETQEVYTINANEGAKFVGNLSGTAGSDKEYSIINVEDKASIEQVDGNNVSVVYTMSTLAEGEETVLPTNNNGDAIINTLNVTNISLGKKFIFGGTGTENAKDDKYPSFGAVETLNVTGNINISKNAKLSLVSGTTVNIKGNSTLTDGTLAWNNGREAAVVKIAAGCQFTNRGQIDGGTNGVTIQSETVGTAYGKFNNLGTVANSTNIGDKSWWQGAEPEATALTAGTSLTRSGIYSVENGSSVTIGTMTTKDVVKFVKGTAYSISISKADRNNLANIGEVIVGSEVTLNLGVASSNFEWADSEETATVPTNIVGETGSHVVVTYSGQERKTYDWNGSAWVEQEAGN